MWREVLLYQFHDILPGSSITRVYDESLARYTAIMDTVNRLTARARNALLGEGDTAYVFNPLSWERTEWLPTRFGWSRVTVPGLGLAPLAKPPAPPQVSTLRDGPEMENDILLVRFDASTGAIVSVFDKEAGSEALAAGASANVLAVYEDVGDAWDIHVDYRERPTERFILASVFTKIDGPCIQRVCEYTYRTSTLRQRVVLTAGSRRLDFDTTVDWKERGRMLRTSFPVSVENDHATFDIQFGSIERPTRRNTSWDAAQFEVCAQKWADLSQGDRGVALLNDCKYGYSVQDNVLDLDLLRSPGYPDPVADAGAHQFTYALYPHRGDFRAGGVVRAAYELNVPLSPIMGSIEHGPRSFLDLEGPGAESVVVEAVKLAEDSHDVVVRLYESQGIGARVRLTPRFAVRAADAANMLEEPSGALAVNDAGIALEFRPFEIKTVILRTKGRDLQHRGPPHPTDVVSA